MKKIYFVQVGVDFGNTIYLPYAAGAIIASCMSNSAVAEEYEFADIIYKREKLATVLDKIVEPYMVAFSCNIWNIEFNKALAKLVKERYPDCIINFGGHSVGNSVELMETEEYIDILSFGEGELTIPELLLHLVEGNIEAVKSIAYRRVDSIIKTPLRPLGNIEEYPSPYTFGLFDKIVAENPTVEFSAILETNRGCPYSCAFCDWTHGKKMRFFTKEKIEAEIKWMADHHIEFCYGIDSNFGMFNRDLEITDFIVENKKKYGYPKIFRTNYEKNSTERVFYICNRLNSEGMDRGATISYQTLCPEALKNIGRKNLTLEHFSELMRRYNKAGISTYSELILGFPGETYESFCRGICTLLEQGQHSSLFVYNCELLPNAVMSEPKYIEKHKIKSIKTYFKPAHSKANSNDEVHEYSHLVRATDTMNEDDWVKSNLFSICVQCFHSLGLLRYFALYLYNEHITDYFTFYSELSEFLLSATGGVGKVWRMFRQRYADSLAGEWHYHNPEFGDITWTNEEGAYLEILYSWEENLEVLLPYLSRFNIPEDIFKELLIFQSMMLRKLGDTSCETVFNYNLPLYFERIIERKESKLIKSKTHFEIVPKKQYTDWQTYAREALWYGRRKEANLYHKDEYKTTAL